MNPLRTILPAALAFTLAAPAWAADAVTLKQQWQVGKRYHQTMKVEQSQKIALGGQSMDQKTAQQTEMVSTVTKHEDGKRKRLAVTYTRMVMDMEMMGQKTHFDTSDAAAATGDPFGIGKMLGAMVGKEMKIVLGADEQIEDIENIDEIMKGALGGSPLAGMISGMMNKDTLSSSFKQAGLQALPAKPVKPGDSWPFTMEMKMPPLGAMGVKGTYTYKGRGSSGGVPCEQIDFTGKLAVDMNLDGIGKALGAGAGGDSASGEKPPVADLIKSMGMKMEGGDYNGTVLFDNALGIAREVKTTQTMSMSMTNPADGQAMKIPMTQAMTITLTKVEDAK